MTQSDTLWTPSRPADTKMEQFRNWINKRGGLSLDNYAQLHRWSVEQSVQFWVWLAEYCQLEWQVKPNAPFIEQSEHPMIGQKWFPSGQLNYAENLLRGAQESTVESYREGCPEVVRMSARQLNGRVFDIQNKLIKWGLTSTDRVAAVVANTDLALSAMLASTALGASWASCSPDFGATAIIDRMSQLSPKILFYTPRYEYGGKHFDCLDKLKQVLAAIPSIQRVILLDHLPGPKEAVSGRVQIEYLGEILSNTGRAIEELKFASLPFDHPLFILFSSGTTGNPKCIVHSAGGTLLQHKKEHMLHCGISEDSKLLYFTTCGWMMWNWMVTALASGSSLALFDGAVFFPHKKKLWDIVSQLKVTHFGTSPKFLATNEKAGFVPKLDFDFSSLNCLLSTGSPLLPEQFEWVYSNVRSDLHLASICGGTDIISCFMLGSPSLPVKSGRIQCRGLGMAVEAWDESQKPVRGKKGELVCTQAFPSMPVGFFGDTDNKNYLEAYFSHYTNEIVWQHGDFIEIDDDGMIEVFGRSDATLNPGGVRIGTSEIYRVVEGCQYVNDSICIGVPVNNDIEIWLFVVLGEHAPKSWADELKKQIKTQLSPRHLPARMERVPGIPYTRSGKKVELAVLNVITGKEVKNVESLNNPETLEYFRKLATIAAP